MNYLDKIITDIELHAVEGLKECFENGIDPNQNYQGKRLFDQLTSEYTRTPRFKACVKLFVDYGLQFEDKALLAVLLDDSASLKKQLEANPDLVTQKITLKTAYTPLEDVTLLFVCAEFNHVSCARLLLKYHADINAKAGIDEYGFGGQTPIFHTVNQNNNQSKEMLELLLASSVDLSIMVQGIIWGKGYVWETLIPAVTPISYAMTGLLPQMHRDEKVINETVLRLIQHQYNIDYPIHNVPNQYLNH